MDDRYRVQGGIGGPGLPGVVGPAELDGRIEWVPARPADLLDAVEARLGSEADLHKVVLGVLAPLCPALDGAPLGALVAHLPLSLARELADPDAALATPVRSPRGAGDYLVEVARLVLHPPPRAATFVRAVFAASRGVLTRAESDAIAARLPADLADLWRRA